ncbi:AraC family transcriptional regulator [Lentzea sp. NPDC051213]|uniref:AraC family transcriptional regulator n=1 Tax=Lentzea sp. NPDC051213 TaxID=3364126 RepID=UPI003798C455
MDVLSDVITVMRTGTPRSARFERREPWEQHYPPVPGSLGFHVVVSGTCRLEDMTLQAGDIVVVSDQEHTMSGESPCVTLCGAYEVDPSRLHPLLRSLPPLLRTSSPSAVSLLNAELAYPALGSDALVPAMLDVLLVHALRAWCTTVGEGWAAALRDHPVTTALQAMHDTPAAPWTVAKLAATAGLSRATFARRFTAYTGQPPLTYLTWWRMTLAARVLRSTDAPLSSVAAGVGYASEFAFAAAFKRSFGVAPGRYRRSS